MQKNERTTFGLISRVLLRETISVTTRPRKDYQQDENYQSNQQNSGVPQKKEAEQIGFEKFPGSNSCVIWKVLFKIEVCSSSSFPKEAMGWINEIDSARNMDELISFTSILGRMLPDFWVLGSKIASALKKVATTDFKRRKSTWKSKRHNKTIDS